MTLKNFRVSLTVATLLNKQIYISIIRLSIPPVSPPEEGLILRLM